MDQDQGQADDMDSSIAQEDSWVVISAYFEEKGLVRQQLDSFNEFVQHTVQELVAAQYIDLNIKNNTKQILLLKQTNHNTELNFLKLLWPDHVLVNLMVPVENSIQMKLDFEILLTHQLCTLN